MPILGLGWVDEKLSIFSNSDIFVQNIFDKIILQICS